MDIFDLQDICMKTVQNNNTSDAKTIDEMYKRMNQDADDTVSGYAKQLSMISEAEQGWLGAMGGDDDDKDDDQSDNSDSNDQNDASDSNDNDDGNDGDDNDGDDQNQFGGASQTNETSGDSTEVGDFGVKLLMFATEVHFWHLNCDTNSAHEALKELYEAFTDLADKLIEAVIGSTNQPIKPSMDNIDFGDLQYGDGCIEKIRSIGSEAANLIDNEDEGINNILGDVCEACDSAVYKLTRLS